MAEQQLYTGQQLGHYRLVRLLGQGGFAEVYLGEHIHLTTLVAVKVLHTRLAPEDMQEFRREAQTVARLIHPNIVRVLDFGVEHSIPYLVMDYAPNGTLRHLYPKGSRVPLPAVVSVVTQVAAALQYAHDRRLIHRDIKPENMLLGHNREVLLSDFGIALVLQSSHTQSTRNIAGTVAYMAPEQIHGHPCPASDQYSLGIAAYEWLCGNRPFQGSFTEIAVKQTMVPPPSLREQVSGLSVEVERVVMKALHKDPQERFASIAAFAMALEQAALRSLPQQVHASRGQFQSTQHLSQFMTTPSSPVTPPFPAPPTSPPLLHNRYQTAPGDVHTGQPDFPLSSHPTPNYPAPVLRYDSGQAQFTAPSSLTDQAHTQHLLTRRTFIAAGVTGAVAASGIAAWAAYSRIATHTGPTIHQSGPVDATSTPANAASNLQNPGQAPLELTYTGHDALVWKVSWSPDGTFIASGSMDGTLQVWTADKGERKLSVRSTIQPAQSDDYPWSLAWSHRNKRRLAASFVDGTIQVLDMNSGQRLPSLESHTLPVVVIAWSPDERYLAAGGSDDIVRVYEYPTWKVITTYREHLDFIKALAWSPDGTWLASGSSDTQVHVWRPLSGHTDLVYKEHSGDIASLSWSPDSTRIVSTAHDQTARIWKAATGTTLATYTSSSGAPIGEASWSHNGRSIAVYRGDASMHILDAQTARVAKSYLTGVIYGLSWSPDDTRIVTGSYNKVAQIWRIA